MIVNGCSSAKKMVGIDPKGIQAPEMVVSSKMDCHRIPEPWTEKPWVRDRSAWKATQQISKNQQTQQKSMFFMVLSPNHQLLILILM